MSTINIAAGQLSKRQHLRNGAGTACNRRTSGIGNNDFEDFKWIAEKHPEYDVRVSILGHLQRGGSPSAFDRVLASRLGVSAVEALLDDQKSIMVGMVNRKVVHVPFNQALKNKKELNPALLSLTEILSI